MSEENKAIMRQFVDAMNGKDGAKFESLIHPNYMEHNPAPGQGKGPRGVRDFVQTLFNGFPDLKITINQLVAEGDWVVAAATTEGTQTGEFMGIPAGGHKISITEMHMLRIADGKAAEHWGVADGMTMMQQLGVMGEE